MWRKAEPVPFCPRCESEYREGITECPDCKVELVDKRRQDPAPPKLSGDVELVEVFTAQGQVGAYAVKDRLESAGVPAVIKSMENPYYDGLMVHMTGYWGKVYVKKEDGEKAAQIIERAMAEIEDEPEE